MTAQNKVQKLQIPASKWSSGSYWEEVTDAVTE